MQIDVVVFPGFDELDALAPYEVLKTAAPTAGFSVRLISRGGPCEIIGGHGLRVHSEADLPAAAAGQAPPADLFIIPGGGWVARTPAGARVEVERGDLPRAIAGWARHGGSRRRAPPAGSHALNRSALMAGTATGWAWDQRNGATGWTAIVSGGG
jgi:hypothetical protein